MRHAVKRDPAPNTFRCKATAKLFVLIPSISENQRWVTKAEVRTKEKRKSRKRLSSTLRKNERLQRKRRIRNEA
jgi:hypothetical protein